MKIHNLTLTVSIIRYVRNMLLAETFLISFPWGACGQSAADVRSDTLTLTDMTC